MCHVPLFINNLPRNKHAEPAETYFNAVRNANSLTPCSFPAQGGAFCCCRAMPIPVIGSVSEPEAIGLGKLFQAHARKQTGTLINGTDMAADTGDSFCGSLRGFFISQTGLLSTHKCPLIHVSWKISTNVHFNFCCRPHTHITTCIACLLPAALQSLSLHSTIVLVTGKHA